MKLLPLLVLSLALVLSNSSSLLEDVRHATPNELNEGMVVRESTVDLQIRVGHRLYVFGKSSGNLEKVKIGMHVLEIAQNKEIPGIASVLKKVEWKKQKDGSVTISSFYDPWPQSLVWSIYPSGELKLLISGAQVIDQFTGLGFNIPENDLQQVRVNDVLLSEGFSDRLHSSSTIQKAQIDFSEVKLIVKSDPSGFHFSTVNPELAQPQADLIFYFPNQSASKSDSVTSSNSKPSSASHNATLWFDFQ